MENLIEVLNYNNISVDEYKEKNILCGYELNTYTNGGVNMIVFLDFRDSGDVTSPYDFAKKFSEYMDSTDINKLISLHRQDKTYVSHFTISKSLKDFKNWIKEMKKIISKCSK